MNQRKNRQKPSRGPGVGPLGARKMFKEKKVPSSHRGPSPLGIALNKYLSAAVVSVALFGRGGLAPYVRVKGREFDSHDAPLFADLFAHLRAWPAC